MLRFELPGLDLGVAVRVVGRVCWVRTEEDGPAGMGIQFVEIEASDRRTIEQYVVGLLPADDELEGA
jgi:hypothetical protein